tara:strand:- start:218 stop:415 length:198 start_codon:yes stop_codon:yes gene_type:complete
MSDNQWESQEIATWVVNDESLYRLARESTSAYGFFEALGNYGLSEIGGITVTPENVRESFEDAND